MFTEEEVITFMSHGFTPSEIRGIEAGIRDGENGNFVPAEEVYAGIEKKFFTHYALDPLHEKV